jgi:hypothetical protein
MPGEDAEVPGEEAKDQSGQIGPKGAAFVAMGRQGVAQPGYSFGRPGVLAAGVGGKRGRAMAGDIEAGDIAAGDFGEACDVFKKIGRLEHMRVFD